MSDDAPVVPEACIHEFLDEHPEWLARLRYLPVDGLDEPQPHVPLSGCAAYVTGCEACGVVIPGPVSAHPCVPSI